MVENCLDCPDFDFFSTLMNYGLLIAKKIFTTHASTHI